MVEIYCESIKDLLSVGPGSTDLSVQHDKELGTIIAGATKVCCLSDTKQAQHWHMWCNVFHCRPLLRKQRIFSNLYFTCFVLNAHMRRRLRCNAGLHP